jgi:Mg2+ and Co2+ transporter CorA
MYALECEQWENTREQYRKHSQEISQLRSKVDRLVEDAKTSVEINDDDHGKAILVFTIVTLVFLPLSFVSSFLGMNTADIRNQTASQRLFWIVALPVTAVVVVIALLIGYKYETLRDYLERATSKSQSN